MEGFPNLGNTCYMNATLQMLLHIPCFTKYFLTKPITDIVIKNYQKHPKATKLAVKFQMLTHAYWISPTSNKIHEALIGFLKKLGKIFKSANENTQNDMHEFLIILLDAIHDGLNDNGHSIADLFTGIRTYQTVCENCKNVSKTHDSFRVLEMEIGKNTELIKIVNDNFAPIRLSNDNLYKCDRCHQLTRATRFTSFKKLPKILFILLKRYHYDNHGNATRINSAISVPELLDFTDFNNHHPCIYSIMSVGCHFGSLDDGHYVSLIKIRQSKQSHSKWILFDDSKIAEVTEESINSSASYLLCYHLDT